MTKKVTITDHVERFVAMKQKLGCEFTRDAQLLRRFARFADDRNETFIRSETAVERASASTAGSQSERVRMLHTVHALACYLHAEDARHEVPPRDVLGYLSRRRPRPYLISAPDIRKLLTAALAMRPAGTIAPLTWHHLFGLVIRNTKFRKSRMVALHPSTRDALNRYLTVRRKEKTLDGHLFVITTGGPPSVDRAEQVFRELAEQTGIRKPGAARGPTPHSLRHSFAVRSLENFDPGADPSRHMLALATYLGHANASHTYWYLESTPVLLRGIVKDAEQAHMNGGSDD